MQQILVIDDDAALCELVTEYLEPDGYKIEAVYDGASGVTRALSDEHALAVLEYSLPTMDGFEALRHIRAHSRLPIVMLSARGDDLNRIIGLQLGADDYLAKPFNPLELVARIKAVLRRTQIDPERERERDISVIGDIEIDRRTRTVRRAGEVVNLTFIEYSLLEKLLSQPGRILERTGIVKEVLRRDLSPLDRSLDTHLSNLRRKLGHQVNGVERIKTVRGVGYIYASPESGKLWRNNM
jgi:two-component system, OmpR family, response regulator CpxR